ncbi:saccharopine dehydrogenase NADP-binding domain-containing protein [Mesorhizobium sp. M0622]|uniref:saccharopine dehydrogenase NADP-binding domain-containing protein n=1 Tax=unclassified Mesorhizobium TaxID=325217 RepID=UPI0033379CE4
MKVLIVGGYGTFGGRIVELLEDEPRLILIVAGRSLARADAYCKKRAPTEARLVPALFDRDGDLAAQFAALRPNIVVDASGPFQAYGEGRYRLIEACIAQRVNYLDLADGSDSSPVSLRSTRRRETPGSLCCPECRAFRC